MLFVVKPSDWEKLESVSLEMMLVITGVLGQWLEQVSTVHMAQAGDGPCIFLCPLYPPIS